MQVMQVRSLDQEDPLEKEIATHSSILAWKIPWTEEPEGLTVQSHKESDMTKWVNNTNKAIATIYSQFPSLEKRLESEVTVVFFCFFGFFLLWIAFGIWFLLYSGLISRGGRNVFTRDNRMFFYPSMIIGNVGERKSTDVVSEILKWFGGIKLRCIEMLLLC